MDASTLKTMTTVKALTIMLNKPEDWHVWLEMIKDRCLVLDIWKYIDPSLPIQPQEPVKPPTPARTVTDLTWYKLDLQQHKEFQSASNQVSEILAQTVNKFYQSSTRGKATLWAKLRALQEQCKPHDLARQFSLIDQLNRLKRGPNRAAMDQWLNEWQGYLVDATEIDLPDVKNGRIQLDFLFAVQKVNKPWADLEIHAFMKVEKDNQPTLLNLIGQYRRSGNLVHAENTTKRTYHAFSAQDNFENHAIARDNPDTVSVPTLQGRKPSRRPFKKCLCGKDHWYHECWYLIESIRPSNWVPDAEIMKTVQQTVERDNRLQDRVKRAQYKATHKALNLRSWRRGDSKGPGANSFPHRVANNGDDDPGNLTAVAAAHSVTAEHALKHRWILDSGSDIHITNNRNCLHDLHRPSDSGKVFAGTTVYDIEAVGTAVLEVATPNGGIRQLTIREVAYVPGFMTNIVSLSRLTNRDIHWNTQTGCLFRGNLNLAVVSRLNGHWTISNPPLAPTYSALSISEELSEQEENEGPNTTPKGCVSCLRSISAASFPVQRSKSDSNLSFLWHGRLGHPGVDALSHLPTATTGVPKFVMDWGVCETCRLSKATQQISRDPRREMPEQHPFYRVSCDILEVEEGYNGDQVIVHFHDYLTSFNCVFTQLQREGLSQVFQRFFYQVKTLFQQTVRIVRMDSDSAAQGDDWDEFVRRIGITIEPTASNTPAQNGHAERFGRTLSTKARSLRVGGNLPHSLWPEIVKTAGYLINRTPTRKLGWKTPFEALHGRKPSLSHLHIIGCKAFVLNYSIPKKMKLEPRALVGYLVGYDSTNIWRIWHPTGKTIIRSRDVTFDEGQIYDPNDDDNLISLEQWEPVPDVINLSSWQVDSTDVHDDELDPTEDMNTVEITTQVPPQGSGSKLATQNAEITQLPTPGRSPDTQAESSISLELIQTSSRPSGGVDNEDTTEQTQNPPTSAQDLLAAPMPPTTVLSRRYHEITADPSQEDILPEGSRRTRRRKLHYNAFAQKLNEEDLNTYHSAFIASLTESTRIHLKPLEQPLPYP